jgi:riboflavin biosynthesis pyrimidine reductase
VPVRHPLSVTGLVPEPGPLDDDLLAERYAPLATPWLRVNFVSSIDGAAEVEGVTAGLSNPQDQRVMELLRMRCDALLLGAGTFRTEGYGPLWLDENRRRWRRTQAMPEHPTLVVVSRSLDLDPDMPAFAAAPTRPIVLAPATAPAAARARLAATAEVVIAGQETVDLAEALSRLHSRGLRQVLCEGGPHLLGELVSADLVDEVCLTLSPLLAGPGASRIVAGLASRPRSMSLHRVLVAAGDTLLLRYVRTGPA